MEAAAETVIGEYGQIDVLLNVAGGNSPEATTGSSTSFFELSAGGIKNVLDVNFVGTMLASQVFGEYMVEEVRASS